MKYKILKKFFSIAALAFETALKTPLKIRSFILYYSIKYKLVNFPANKINLCSGTVKIEGWCNIDIHKNSDLIIDLGKKLLPFAENTVDAAVCISSINYFDRKRGEQIIKDIYRVLKSGGVARFATQDLKLISEKYINNDKEFFFQKLPNGKERFVGETMCDKFNSWFYGYAVTKGKGCKYFYDYETLSLLFRKAGFKTVERKSYLESRIPGINKIDNRPDQMFFLEAIK